MPCRLNHWIAASSEIVLVVGRPILADELAPTGAQPLLKFSDAFLRYSFLAKSFLKEHFITGSPLPPTRVPATARTGFAGIQ